MKKHTKYILMVASVLSVFLSGCRAEAKPDAEPESKAAEEATAPGTTAATTTAGGAEERQDETESGRDAPALPYQFVKGYGIIQAEEPVYTLDMPDRPEQTKGDVTVQLSSVVQKGQELIVNFVLTDYTEAGQTGTEETITEDRESDASIHETQIPSQRYQDELWRNGEGLFLVGPDIPEEGYQPKESMYMSDPDFYKEFGHMRYFIVALFENPSAPDLEQHPSGYAFQVLDFENPIGFSMKRASAYDTLEQLAAGEQAGIDTHDGVTLIAMGEKAKDGMILSGYIMSEDGNDAIGMFYRPMGQFQEEEQPILSNGDKQYSIVDSPSASYRSVNPYRFQGDYRTGRCQRFLFDVPEAEQDARFTLTNPGLIFNTAEESQEITLKIPEDSEELTEVIPFQKGAVRLLKITRMKDPQYKELTDYQGNVTKQIEKAAVYLEVKAEDSEKALELKRMICKRHRYVNQWENQRYDFDEDGNISGFRIFCEEGETEITLKFFSPAFYWKQTYEMGLPVNE